VVSRSEPTQEARPNRRGWLAVVIAAVIPVAIGVAAVFTSPPMTASAFGGYLTSPGAPTGALSSCVLCHSNYPTTYVRNAYGLDFAANAHSYSTIGNLDSDGDGYTNSAEIAAGTWPGDANTTPVPAPSTIIKIYVPLNFSGRQSFSLAR
jgi:hypothetical protein